MWLRGGGVKLVKGMRQGVVGKRKGMQEEEEEEWVEGVDGRRTETLKGG